MKTSITNSSLLVYARIAGFSYLITMMLGIFTVNYAESKIVVKGNHASTLDNLVSNESLFRTGIASEILMYVLVILLSFSLYVILKSVNRNLALLALLMRLAEAIVGVSTTVVSGLIPLLLLRENSFIELEQANALIELFLNARGAGLDIVLIFIGVGGTIFSYLFFKSRCVPRVLAAWGILTYITMFAISFISILLPDLSASIKWAFYAPGGVFEMLFGLWLLFKGINVERLDTYGHDSPESALSA